MKLRASLNPISIQNGAVLTHSTSVSGLVLNVANTISISSDSAIDVSFRGEDARPDTEGRAGGSYGGRGEPESWYSRYYYSCDTCGDAFEPVDLGSGANGSNNRGGGAVKLIADTLQLDGALRADGTDGESYAGGGSGGSIWLDVGTLQGSGTLQANGGLRGSDAGNGGGGRMALYAGDLSAFSTTTLEAKAESGAAWGSVFVAAPRRVRVRATGAGSVDPAGPVVIPYGDTNRFSLLPDADSSMDGAFANSDYLGRALSEYCWVNSGIMRGTMSDLAWSDRVFNGDLLDVVFSFGAVDADALPSGFMIGVPGASNWVYSLEFKEQLSDELWTPVEGQQDVPCSEDGAFYLTDGQSRTQAFYRVTGHPAQE